MESIEKLRETFEKCTHPVKDEMIEFDTVWIVKDCAMAMLDDIETEIDRDYIKLPVDADSETIHVGDICEMSEVQFKVRQLNTDGYCWWAVDETGEFYIAELCRHIKPRTLEDVLIEYRLKAYNLYADDELTGEQRVAEFVNLDAEYNSEIRELIGGDAS